MKKLGSFLKSALPHCTLILNLMLLVFYTIDFFNESMAFLNNSITKNLLGFSALLTVILSVLSIWDRTHNNK